MGIALQSWERHGWRGSLPQVYWFWRDRKGLLGNPLSLFTNFLFVYGFVTWMARQSSPACPGDLARCALHPALLGATLLIQIIQTSVRMGCAARLYGRCSRWGCRYERSAATGSTPSPPVQAVWRYSCARVRHQPLVWLKTEHAYPSRNALMEHKRKLGEILVGSGYVSEADVKRRAGPAAGGSPAGGVPGANWERSREDELYEALSLQQSLPVGRLEPQRSAEKWRGPCRVMWFAIGECCRTEYRPEASFCASPEIPTDELNRVLRGFTRLSVRFQLVTPGNFEELTAALL